jgi:hypothetical protein
MLPHLLRWCRTRSIAQALACRLDAFEQQLEPRDIELVARAAAPIADELPLLQALGPQAEAAAVEVQRLEMRAESNTIPHTDRSLW